MQHPGSQARPPGEEEKRRGREPKTGRELGRGLQRAGALVGLEGSWALAEAGDRRVLTGG